jgi:DNA invertase Pin-like site-specific DNA recombinase
MAEHLVGYARCSTDDQDLTAQRERLRELGVADKRIYLDHGLTGTTRARPGLDQALAAVRAGDTLVVAKLDRLARSVPDARAIGDDLTARGIRLSLGGQVYDPTDRFLAVSSGFGDQVGVVPAWRVDEGGDVSLAACLSVMVA